MCIREERVELGGSIEILESLLVLFLQRVAISQNTPRFRLMKTSLEGIVGNITQFSLLLQLPKASRVVFETFEAVRLLLQHELVKAR